MPNFRILLHVSTGIPAAWLGHSGSPPLVLPAGGPGIRQRGLWGTLRRGPGGCPGCGGILPGPEGGGTNGAWPGQEGVAALSLEIRVCKQRALISSGCITN